MGRIRARYLTARLPNPPVRPVRETFTSYGSRERDVMGHFHFASSTAHSPWTALRVRWVPLYYVPTRSLRALPKPRCRHLDSATKPDMNVSVHPAPQQRGVCHTYLAKGLRARVRKQYKGTQRTRKAVHGEGSVELAKWTFPIISLAREPYEVKASRTGLTGGLGRRAVR